MMLRGNDRMVLACATPGPKGAFPRQRNNIHFNNAGCSMPAPGVADAVQLYLKAESEYGGYEASELPELAIQLERPYQELADLLGCDPASVGVVNSATAAWQRIFLGLPLWLPGSCIFTSVAEYGSNYLAYLQAQKRYGTRITVVREREDSSLDVGHLQELLAGRNGSACNVVSISHIPTSSGRVYDAEAVGAVVKEFPDVVYLLDACQSVGQLPVDVGRIGCHFLTATGRKYLRAPRGCGFLYAAPAILQGNHTCPGAIEPAALDVRGGVWLGAGAYEMHETARRYEEYEMSFAAKVGLGVACAYARDQGIESAWTRIRTLAATLRQDLRRIPAVTVHDRGAELCGIVSFSLDGWQPAAVKAVMLRAGEPGAFRGCGVERPAGVGFNVSVSEAPSTRLDFDRRGLASVVRASVHAYNTEEEVQEFVELVQELVAITEHAAKFQP
eukprot:jgi/Ulvmu1/10762/UM068_0052.1